MISLNLSFDLPVFAGFQTESKSALSARVWRGWKPSARIGCAQLRQELSKQTCEFQRLEPGAGSVPRNGLLPLADEKVPIWPWPITVQQKVKLTAVIKSARRSW